MLTLYVNLIYSQTTTTSFTPRINNIPTSPEASLLGRFGNIPVGHYTGTANITIPIYSIKEAGVEIPIELRYHSSGIKVADEATWVGLGWDLSPGGTIIQEIRGKEDHLDSNLNYVSEPQNYQIFKNNLNMLTPPTYSYDVQEGYNLNYNCYGSQIPLPPGTDTYFDPVGVLVDLLDGEGQPDIYHYNFAGYSGKFFIHPETHQIILIDKKEDIYFEHDGNGSNWVVRTQDGNVYNFGALETSTGNLITQYKGRTHKLTSINFSNGKNVTFEYVNETYAGMFKSENATINGSPWSSEYPISGNDPITNNNNKKLSKITTHDAIIDFNLENREDINKYSSDNVKRLRSIDIKSKVTGQKVKTFEFQYSYFPFNYVGVPMSLGSPSNSFVASHVDAFGKRLKLDEVKEIGYNGTTPVLTASPYKFEYETSIIMPLKCSYSRDFWGYYNGENNSALLPNLDYFDYQHNPLYLNVDSTPFVYNYEKNNRYTNNAYSGAYMLKKIIYPTKGFSEFQYEPNSFTNQFIPDKTKLNQAYKINNLEDKNYASDQVVKSFQLSKATTISFVNKIYNGYTSYLPSFTPYNYAQMQGAYIQLIKFNIVTYESTLIKRWDLTTVLNADFTANNGKEWIEDVRIEYDSNPNIRYTVSVSLPDGLANNSFGSVSVKSYFTYYDDTGVDTSISNQCGLRTKEIKNFSSEGNLASYKRYNYFEGKLLNRFEPIEFTDVMYTKCVWNNSATSPGYIIHVTPAKRININSDNFTASDGNLIGYGRVEEIELANNSSAENLGKKVFYYHNVSNENKKGFPAIVNLKNGLLNKEEIFDRLNQKLVETSYGYGNINPNWTSYLGLIISSRIIGDTDYIESPTDESVVEKYVYGGYSIISEQNVLLGKSTKEYFNGNFITNTENYNYNLLGKIDRVTTTNSKNETISKWFTYSGQENTSTDPASNAMFNRKMTGIPVRITSYNGSSLISTHKENYNIFGSSLILPSSMSTSKGTSDLETKITYEVYDGFGNLMQYRLENGIPVTIIWGYNWTLPIAKIENSTITEIVTALGESNIYDVNENDLTAINNLRTTFPNAQITTFTHLPLIGVSSITDPKGDTITYHYDSFGRLQFVKDKNGKILSENEYNYKP